MASAPVIAVVGVGNLLLGDDGLGVQAVRHLRGRFGDPRVRVIDGGTIGLGLLPYLEDATHLLFLDAVEAPDVPPGTLVVRDLAKEALPGGAAISPHDLGLESLVRLLRALRGEGAPTMHLAGVTPASVELSTELSPAGAAALPRLAARAESIVHGWLQSAGAALPAGASSGGGMTPCVSECLVK